MSLSHLVHLEEQPNGEMSPRYFPSSSNSTRVHSRNFKPPPTPPTKHFPLLKLPQLFPPPISKHFFHLVKENEIAPLTYSRRLIPSFPPERAFSENEIQTHSGEKSGILGGHLMHP